MPVSKIAPARLHTPSTSEDITVPTVAPVTFRAMLAALLIFTRTGRALVVNHSIAEPITSSRPAKKL